MSKIGSINKKEVRKMQTVLTKSMFKCFVSPNGLTNPKLLTHFDLSPEDPNNDPNLLKAYRTCHFLDQENIPFYFCKSHSQTKSRILIFVSQSDLKTIKKVLRQSKHSGKIPNFFKKISNKIILTKINWVNQLTKLLKTEIKPERLHNRICIKNFCENNNTVNFATLVRADQFCHLLRKNHIQYSRIVTAEDIKIFINQSDKKIFKDMIRAKNKKNILNHF